MTTLRAQIKSEIETAARKDNCTEIQLISHMQSITAKLGDNRHLELLSDIKMDYISALI